MTEGESGAGEGARGPRPGSGGAPEWRDVEPREGAATRVLVLLHGRGADADDLVGLVPALPATWRIVLPRAPFPGAPWGYGPGRAWYRYLGEDRPEPASYARSLEAVDALLAELRQRWPSLPLALGGFSQGGTVSLGYALSRPGSVPAVLNFSGFLPDHPAVRAEPDTVAGTRIFWGHGRQDPAIPFAMAERGRARLRSAGADLVTSDHDIGHWIDRSEVDEAVRWWEGAGEPGG